MIANGWTLYYYRVFKAALDELEATVTKLARDDPKGYKAHPKTKLLASVYSALAEAIPANPSATEFKPSKSFSADAANWRRVKFDAPVGSRLFFRFAEKPSKVLVSVWIDDSNPGSDADQIPGMVEAFRQMLGHGQVPPDIRAVLDWRRK